MFAQPFNGDFGKPSTLQFTACGNVGRAAVEGIRNGTVRAKKDPTVSDLAEMVVHFGKCVKREDRRHKINRCVRLQPVPKPINNSLISTVTQKLHRIPIFAMSLRSEEHTSELQSLMHISYAVFCLKKKKTKINQP